VRQLPQEQRVAPGPWHRRSITGGEREPGQQRRGLGQRRAGPLEADADLLVQRFDQGDLSGLVPPDEFFSKPRQPVRPLRGGQLVKDPGAPRQLGDDPAAEGGLLGRFDQVDLHQAGQVGLCRELAEQRGNRAIAVG
jgi:hypothetical protein